MDERLRRLIALGREHYRSHDFGAAEEYLSQVIKEHRGFADVFNMLGCIYHGQGKYPQAQECFEEAIKLNPRYTEAALNLSVTYNDLGKYQQAREVYMLAIERTREEPRSLDPFVKGKLANMHADLGAAYADSGLHQEAIREYRKALELCPSFVDLRTRLASVYRDMGDPTAAVQELEHVKTTHPRYVPARLALGTALFMAGRREEATQEWEAVLESDSGNKAARVYLQMARDLARGHTAPEMGQADHKITSSPASPDSNDDETDPDTSLDRLFEGLGPAIPDAKK
jgi:tetratricopeptide (TPR) repeat protein